jgi:cephalosporin-C deacetylase
VRGPILEPYPPDDFREFWERIGRERSHRLAASVRTHEPNDDIEGLRVERIDFKGDAGGLLQGWIAIPQDATTPLPGHLWLPAYGCESHLPDEYSCYPGFVSMSYNLHGLGAFHREPYSPEKGYLSEGLADPETWVFRSYVLDALRALDILADQREVQPEALFCGGFSQGGGLALMVAAASDRVRAVCSDMPFLSSMPWTIRKAAYRYPYKEFRDFAEGRALGMEIVLATLSYYDTLNVATLARCPVQVSCGTRDPASPPNTVEAIARALPYPKNLVVYEGAGHDWVPQMSVNNAAWYRREL